MHPNSSPAQPTGLYVLCAVEVAAGFALYMLGSLLLLFLIETQGLDEARALVWVGGYNAALFIAPLAGGALADGGLRLRRAVRLGALALCLGFVALALVSDARLGLSILVLGSGLFRSNAVALLSRLYTVDDPRRDGAYRLFYAAFNCGGLIAPPLAGVLARSGRWYIAFLLAASAMGLAALSLHRGHRHLAACDARPREDSIDAAMRHGCPPQPPWRMIAAVAQVAMLWALAYGQADGVLLLWARDDAQRVVLGCEITPSTFASVPPVFVLAWTGLAALARRRRRQRRRRFPQRAKIMAGLVTTSIGFALMIVATPPPGQRSSVAWLLACLALLTFGELQVVPLTQSLMGRLLPRRRSGIGYALWYTATALGLYLAGLLGALWSTVAPATFFALVTAAPLAAAARLAFQRRPHLQRRSAAE